VVVVVIMMTIPWWRSSSRKLAVKASAVAAWLFLATVLRPFHYRAERKEVVLIHFRKWQRRCNGYYLDRDSFLSKWRFSSSLKRISGAVVVQRWPSTARCLVVRHHQYPARARFERNFCAYQRFHTRSYCIFEQVLSAVPTNGFTAGLSASLPSLPLEKQVQRQVVLIVPDHAMAKCHSSPCVRVYSYSSPTRVPTKGLDRASSNIAVFTIHKHSIVVISFNAQHMAKGHSSVVDHLESYSTATASYQNNDGHPSTAERILMERTKGHDKSKRGGLLLPS
jgi:hypothetical protein